MHQMRWWLGLRPRPHWGSLQRSPDPLAGGEGACRPLPKNHTPALGPSGLDPRAYGARPRRLRRLDPSK